MKKKGFTLIELLAVIVILAIIALIATPMVLNTIDEARKGSAKSSGYGYINGLETSLASYMLKNNGTSYSAGKYDVSTLNADLNVTVKGDAPSEGKVCVASNGTVTKASLKVSGYIVSYDGKEVKNTDLKEVEDISCVEKTIAYQEYYTGTKTQVSSIYYNPVANAKCTESDYNSNADKLGKTGCMKWYALENSDSSKSTVDVILDHNTTAKVAWNSEGINTEMKEVQTELDSLVTVSEWKVTPKLISADQIATITGAKDTLAWDSSKMGADTPDLSTTISYFYLDGASGSDTTWKTAIATTLGASNYTWIFDYTSGCTSHGCNEEDSSTLGYWTATTVTGDSTRAWYISRDGSLSRGTVSINNGSGIRPVITISKDILK